MAESSKKPSTRAPSEPGKGKPEVRFRMRVLVGDAIALGPGKVELLEAIHENGSISAAARSMGMSYRRAWLLVDEVNRSLKSPATVSEQGGQSGGGCTLTAVGEQIVHLYRDIEAKAKLNCARQIAELTKLVDY